MNNLQHSELIYEFIVHTVWHKHTQLTAAEAHCVRALALQADGWVFESKPRQTLFVKTSNDSSTAKRSAIGVSVTGPRR